jgi:hypothetical protein
MAYTVTTDTLGLAIGPVSEEANDVRFEWSSVAGVFAAIRIHSARPGAAYALLGMRG